MGTPSVLLEPLAASDFALVRPWMDPRIFRIFHHPPPRRNRGHGTEILRQFVRICFVEHGLHRVQLFVDVDNAPAIASYEKAGLRIEGTMREAARTEDGFVSWSCMSILDREWGAAST